MVDAPGIAAEIAAAVHGEDLQLGVTLEHAVEDQVVQGQRSLERIADDVVEVEARQPLALGEAVGMDDDQRAELLGLLPERRKGRVGQFTAGDIGENFDALELERLHAAFELFGGFVAVLHRHGAGRNEAIRVLGDECGDAVIDHARGRHRVFERDGVIALRRRRHHQLHVDAHLVHDGEALVVAGHAAADVGFLLGVDLLGFGRGEMRERNGRDVEMRLDEDGGFRHGDMGVGVDGDALRPRLASRLAVFARRSVRIFIPDRRHVACLVRCEIQ